MTQKPLNDLEISERKLISKGIQKTLTLDTFKKDEIDWDIVKKYSDIIEIDKVIEADKNCFEVVLKKMIIDTVDFQYIKKVTEKIYGKDALFYFSSESEWQISFGVKRIDDEE